MLYDLNIHDTPSPAYIARFMTSQADQIDFELLIHESQIYENY